MEIDGKGAGMTFADIHCHALCGVDDGAKNTEMMHRMIDAEYTQGIRFLCLTPHYHPGYYGRNEEAARQCFEKLCSDCAKKYPDLTLTLANELHYSPECLSWLKECVCRTIRGTRYLLVDFREHEESSVIIHGLFRLVNAGYIPILAHAERYVNIKISELVAIKQDGVFIQVNAGSCLGEFGFHAKSTAKKLLAKRLVDFISTDAHNMDSRAPKLYECYRWIAKKYSENYADHICRDHAVNLFFSIERTEN